MNDIRTQLPECPLAYEVPYIPGKHTALVIPITAADIDWQEKMLPWCLASLINNTDLIVNGVHLKITSDTGITHESAREALKHFDLPEHTCIITSGRPTDPALRTTEYGYDSTYIFDINYWAFRDENNTHKLSIGDVLKHNLSDTEPYPDVSSVSPDPRLYDMKSCTPAQFSHAIKRLLGAQLAMKI